MEKLSFCVAIIYLWNQIIAPAWFGKNQLVRDVWRTEPWFWEWIEHVLPSQMKEMCRNGFFDSDGVDKRVPVGIVSFMRGRKGMKCCKIKSQVIHHDLNERKFNTSARNAIAGCHWQSWKDSPVTQKQAKTCFRDFTQIKGFVLLKISTGWVTDLGIAEKQVTALFTSRISLNSKRQTNNLRCS